MVASLAAKNCCLEFRTIGDGVGYESLVSVPFGVIGSVLKVEQAC